MPTKRGRYTGAWADQRRVVDYASPPANPVDPAHMQPGHLRPGARPPYTAPRMPSTPPRLLDPGTAYDQVMPSQAPGLVLDTTPQDHRVGLGGGGGYISSRPDRAQARANRARRVTRGAALRQVYRRPSMRGDQERYTTEAVEHEPTDAGSRLAALRGANSLPENNPEGFRNGRRIFRWMERPFNRRVRRHDLRPLRPLLAAIARESPPVPEGNRYSSPYGRLAASRSRNMMTPQTRREPRPWDEDINTDGVTDEGLAAAAGYGYGSWGL